MGDESNAQLAVRFVSYLENTIPLYTKDNFFQSHVCACPNPGSDFLSAYVVVRFVCNNLRREVVVCFVDIDRIVGHYCLTFPFINVLRLIAMRCRCTISHIPLLIYLWQSKNRPLTHPVCTYTLINCL